jgi:RNA polymerase sigma factor (sigma-70 family)
MDLTKVQQHSGTPFYKAIKDHSPEFLELMYTRNYPNLEVYIIQNSGNAEDARDIYQEGFIAVWRNIQLGKFHPSTEKEFSAYLFRVCKNKWIDQLRKNKTRPVEAVGNADKLEARHIETEEDEKYKYLIQVRENFLQLGDKCREILSMFYYRKKNLKEIADQYGMTEASAKNSKYRCLQKLRELVFNNSQEK